MLNPRFDYQGTNRVGDNDGIVILCSNSKNKLVALVPCSEILPVARITVNGDVTLRNVIFKHEARLFWVTHLARIGINENNSSLYANDRIACLVEVPVIEIPENARLVNPGTCLNGFIRL